MVKFQQKDTKAEIHGNSPKKLKRDPFQVRQMRPFILHQQSKGMIYAEDIPAVRFTLTFVDLASSERIKKTGSSGNDLKEAQSISKSLSAFEDVISALCSEAQQIPYRNHKLTMLMSDALGGNAKTLMFVNVSPAESCLDETNHFLTFAARVRCILNNPIKNVFSKETARLMKLVSYWREQAGKHGDDEELEEIQEERQTKES